MESSAVPRWFRRSPTAGGHIDPRYFWRWLSKPVRIQDQRDSRQRGRSVCRWNQSESMVQGYSAEVSLEMLGTHDCTLSLHAPTHRTEENLTPITKEEATRVFADQ